MLNKYEVDVENLVKKLTTKQLQDGARTFEINGNENLVGYESCFVAMVYGPVGELNRNELFNIGEILHDAGHSQLTGDEWYDLSGFHFRFAPKLREIVESELRSRPDVTPDPATT